MFNVYAFMPVVPIHVLSDFQLSLAIKLGVRISRIAVDNGLKFQQLCTEANRRYLGATSFKSLLRENENLLNDYAVYMQAQQADLQKEHKLMADDIERLYSESLQRA